MHKGFVTVDGRLVHYRCTGKGPPVVMLHDSPRSSRLHIDTMTRLADRFTVYALDTPGYGNSQPLETERPTIAAFAEALDHTLKAMELAGAPLYATHTSAKIALEYAAGFDRQAGLILDGLSIPAGPPDPAYVDAYMRPFRLDAAGGYLATEWTRMRDMARWFPWFRQTPQARMPIAAQSDAWFADYALDFLSAGPAYASAYSAAMLYDPMPALHAVRCPTVIAAKADDVLYAALDRVPVERNDALTVTRLPADRDAWLAWLAEMFADAAPRPGLVLANDGPATYVDVPHGQMLVRRAGRGTQRPVLVIDAPTTMHALRWQEAFGERPTLVPDLCGYGESDPLETPSLEAAADSLHEMIRVLGIDSVDVMGLGFATPLAATFAARHGRATNRVILDGCFMLDSEDPVDLGDALCPKIEFDRAGGHLHRIWHMLRDSEAQWPWFDGSPDAHRTLSPALDAAGLHQSLVAILKQPARYGDMARLAVQADADARYPVFGQPALIFDRAGDPGYRAATAVADRLSDARIAPRGDDIAATLPVVLAFLGGDVAVPKPLPAGVSAS